MGIGRLARPVTVTMGPRLAGGQLLVLLTQGRYLLLQPACRLGGGAGM